MYSSDTKTQSGCRRPSWSIVVVEVGKRIGHVFTILGDWSCFHHVFTIFKNLPQGNLEGNQGGGEERDNLDSHLVVG